VAVLPETNMRLDLFLKASRLCPRRSIAQELCDAGVVSVNGHVAKAGRAIRVADEITIAKKNRVFTIRVEQIPVVKQVPRADASGLYSIISDISLTEN
jgi:ribosomal 50S subunit-recycling heat shock protein